MPRHSPIRICFPFKWRVPRSDWSSWTRKASVLHRSFNNPGASVLQSTCKQVLIKSTNMPCQPSSCCMGFPESFKKHVDAQHYNSSGLTSTNKPLDWCALRRSRFKLPASKRCTALHSTGLDGVYSWYRVIKHCTLVTLIDADPRRKQQNDRDRSLQQSPMCKTKSYL